MATLGQWIEGARPRTLLMGLAPVVAGTGVAARDDAVVWWHAGAALVVALALQIAVNYANDYSDGVRGTDDERVGPLRLVGSGAARPGQVKAAAFAWFAVGAAAGLALAIATAWWLVAVGAVAILAAWYYTGGRHPYGYAGLGELAVFVFFGLIAVCGTAYVQTRRLTSVGLTVAVLIGLLACALLVVNNLRDIPGDTASGKRTLAVRLGERRTRALFVVFVCLGVLGSVLVAHFARSWWPLLGLGGVVLLPSTLAPVTSGARGPALIPSLRHTGQLALLVAVLLAVGLAL